MFVRHREKNTTGAVKLTALLLCALLFISLPLFVLAETGEPKTVRVGYVNERGYEEGGEGEYKTGYGYEYLQKIAYHTGWRYEYVYGSFGELLAKLSSSEIDLLGNVTMTVERSKQMLFSAYPQGSESFYIFVNRDRKDLQTNEGAIFNGTRIGVGEGSFQEQLLDAYIKGNGLNAQIVRMGGSNELAEALDDGRIDAAAMTDVTDYGYVPAMLLGFNDYYFAVSQDRPDLLAELNEAHAAILSTEPNFNDRVVQKYAFGTVQVYALTRKEADWLSARGSRIRLGYLENNMPFSGKNAEGEAEGVLTTIIAHLTNNFGIQVETVPFSALNAAREALEAGEIDCFGPAFGDFCLSEQFGLMQTDAILSTTPIMLYNGELKTGRIAASEQSIFCPHVVALLYPDAEIVSCDTVEQCVETVRQDKADCTLVSSGQMADIRKGSMARSLHYTEVLKQTDACLFVQLGQTEMLTILNKAVGLSAVQLNGAVFTNTDQAERRISLMEFVQQNLILILVLSSLLVLVLSILLARAHRAEIKSRKSQEEAERASRDVHALNRELNDRISMIQSLTSLFFASYYIDMTADTFTELSGIANAHEKIGLQGKASWALRVLYEKMVAPEFSSGMKEFTDLSTLDERLKNTNSVSYQYIGATSGWSQAYMIAGDRDEQGRLRHVFFAARQIHAEKAREDAQNRALLDARQAAEDARQVAEAANAAKTRFLFNMSHDIRTPMNAIMGYTELLEKDHSDPKKTEEYLHNIHTSGEFLHSLINNVLEMARIENGKTVLEEKPCRTGGVTQNIRSIFADLMKEKHIDFRCHMNVRTPIIFCDPLKLNEIFLNIVSNAYKYTPEGGSVTVNLQELPCDRPGWTMIRQTITDTGYGMSKEYLPKLFEEFTRENNSTQNKIEGTGLGMPIVKKLVELMNGTIEVESELGKGTTFAVTIPHRIADETDLRRAAGREIAPTALAGKRVLLAEDNMFNTEIAVEILNSYGIASEHAADGAQCVEMLSKAALGYYDLVLMDIQMPGTDGYQATRQIRSMADSVKADIPIIAMTANAFEEDRRNAFAAGMDAHLSKPIETHLLIGTIADVLALGSTQGKQKKI